MANIKNVRQVGRSCNDGILKTRLDELGLVRETTFKCFSYWFKLKEVACEGLCRSMRDQVMAAKAAGSTMSSCDSSRCTHLMKCSLLY